MHNLREIRRITVFLNCHKSVKIRAQSLICTLLYVFLETFMTRIHHGLTRLDRFTKACLDDEALKLAFETTFEENEHLFVFLR